MSISTELGAQKQVRCKDGAVSYRERGSGPPIVFVHGVFVNGDLWRKVVPGLAERFRCITPDWPLGSHSVPMDAGADLSTPGLAALVADFLEQLELDDVTLVGNDTGGAITQLVMTGHPERLGRVVLTSCDAFEVYPPSPFGFLRVMGRVPGALSVNAQLLKVAPLRRLPIAYGWVMNDQPEPQVAESYIAGGRRPEIRRDTKKLLDGISPEHTLGAAARFGEVKLPVLLAWGADDRLFPLSLAHRVDEALPTARLEVLQGARTFVPEDQPERLAELIRQFVEEHTATSPVAQDTPARG